MRVLGHRHGKDDVHQLRGFHFDLDRRAFIPLHLRTLLEGLIRTVERVSDQVVRAAAQTGQCETPGGIRQCLYASRSDHDLCQRRAAVQVRDGSVDRAGQGVDRFIRPRTDRIRDLGVPVHVDQAVADAPVGIGILRDA